MSNPLDYLYEAVGWVFTHIYDLLKPAFGPTSGWTWALSIIILVVLMRLIMVPLFIKQMHTTRAMSSLQPQMAALRKKYKNDKQTLNQETMKLYQEAGVNPLMGCLPFVLQLPLFFGSSACCGRSPSTPAARRSTDCPCRWSWPGRTPGSWARRSRTRCSSPHGAYVPLHAKLVIIAAVPSAW